jgi:magnesium transporter
MDPQVIKVGVDTDQEEVARVIAKYNLLAVPVVDPENCLQGMVTVNDIIDVIHEEATEDAARMAGTTAGDVQRTAPSWRAALGRISWLSAAILGGGAAAVVLHSYSRSLASMLPLIYFLPLLLAVGGGFVAQSLAAVGHSQADDSVRLWPALRREIGMGTLVGIVTGLVVAAVVFWWTDAAALGLVLGISLAITLPIAGAVGALLPILLKRAGADPSWASSAVLDPLISVISVFIYLSLATYLIKHLV